MVNISGNKIIVPKGDTAAIPFYSDLAFPFGKYIFGVKLKTDWSRDESDYLIMKELTISEDFTTFEFILSSTDTSIKEGEYHWGLRRISEDGVDTYETSGDFIIARRVVHDTN